ncbi:MAG: YlbF family regulator [Bacillota bacterium]|nr:YlbF family regulator [Bacillota bacterium]
MDVYDAAHTLAKSIKADDNYKKFSALNKELMANNQYKDDIKEFQEKQILLQRSKLAGEELNEDLLNEVQNLYSKLNEVEMIKNYFDLEMKINQMMSDITKILSEAIDIEY